jgi:uncharacterized protein
MRLLKIGFTLVAGLVLSVQVSAQSCISITNTSAITQNFDTLANSGTANTTVPAGWLFSEAGSGANTTYAASTGSDNGGNTYSLGSAGSSDRAFGGLQSASVNPTVGACFTNNTGTSITAVSISYVGEQWRLGTSNRTTAPNVEKNDFQFSTDATSLSSGNWTNVDTLDFTSPISTGTVGALDGNAPANRVAISSMINSLSIANGSTFYIRWQDLNVSGSDDSLAVDDFSLTPTLASVVPALSIDDVTVAEGNSGTTNAVFTITASSALAADATFTVATSDGTATTADSDYVANSQSVTITSGNSSATFTVVVNGDTASELNETFNVTVSGYPNIADATGVGTINNDDAVLPSLSINDVTQAEGNSGSSNFSFTVSLSEPAGAGGVSFDYATSDGSATTANSDYTATNATAATIPAGATFTVINVPVNGDSVVEPNETFNLTLSNASGAIIADAVGVGTITNDDFTPIHDIQGSGRRSPLTVGTIVTTQGIVTARVSNGFYIQTPDAEADADLLTSQALFIFTSTAPSASAAIGARVEVTGALDEFSSTSLLPITELKNITALNVLSTGNTLPAAVVLNSGIINATNTLDTMERYEGMRVTASPFKVIAANGATIVETSATISASAPNGDGIFYVTVPGVARPLREPGIPLEDGFTPSAGKTPPVFDANPERIRVRSQSQTGASVLRVDVGDEIVMTGVLDFFDWYTLLPDPTPAPVITRNSVSSAVSNKAADEFTVGAFNLLRFFDTANDPAIGEPVLTATALTNRLRKTGNAICAYTKNPDILGVVEVENLSVLQQLATTINTNDNNVMFPGACTENPNYEAQLLEGNDVGGIDVGFLIKKTEVRPGVPRVQLVGSPVQIGKNSLFTNADNSTELLNDRPSLKIKAIINDDDGGSVPVTVYVNHLRSLNGITTHTTGSNGWATVSARVRAKRAAQAMELAADIQAEQTTNPTSRIVMVGDFNAFEFNDGYADVMGIVTGREAANDQVETYADSPITAPLTVVPDDAGPARNYSFSFEGNAQSLDHVVVNQSVINLSDAYRAEHARINADFGEDLFGNYTLPQRVSDHDPVVLFVKAQELRPNVDLVTRVFKSPQLVTRSAQFIVSVSNDSTVNAASADVILEISALPEDIAIRNNPWTCAAPVYNAITSTSSIACQIPGGLPAGARQTALIGVSAEKVSASGGTITLSALTGAIGTHDSNSTNNFATLNVAIPAR